MSESIENRVTKVICEVLGVEADAVQQDMSFADDLEADSLDTIELVMGLEREFDLEIADDEAEKIATVQDAIKYVQDKQKTDG